MTMRNVRACGRLQYLQMLTVVVHSLAHTPFACDISKRNKTEITDSLAALAIIIVICGTGGGRCRCMCCSTVK